MVRAMGKWAQRLADEILQTPSGGTDRTDARGVVAVLAVPTEGVSPKLQAANDPARTCGDCRHLLRHGTCGEPVALAWRRGSASSGRLRGTERTAPASMRRLAVLRRIGLTD
ncbi:hypothetical protein [Methylibium sp.]|uniref:hypothetical protein n=1 Tax=Methylibium sp. TaxID=2067992 RepID=UPI0017A9B806|nr:hypothetical protein [Methylibium sp.]MBA3590630.1 hypothetical protein [Methylibium sp.]